MPIHQYRGVPIEYRLGHYFVRLYALDGSPVVHAPIHTESAAKRYITRALKLGARPASFNKPRRRSARSMGAKRNPGMRGRGEISGAFRFLPESIKIRKNGGTVEQIKYQDANDQKHYVHDFEDLGAFMYLCDSALGKCLLIVPGDGATPLWEPA